MQTRALVGCLHVFWGDPCPVHFVIYSITHGICSVPVGQFQFSLNDLERKNHFARGRLVLISPRSFGKAILRGWIKRFVSVRVSVSQSVFWFEIVKNFPVIGFDRFLLILLLPICLTFWFSLLLYVYCTGTCSRFSIFFVSWFDYLMLHLYWKGLRMLLWSNVIRHVLLQEEMLPELRFFIFQYVGTCNVVLLFAFF